MTEEMEQITIGRLGRVITGNTPPRTQPEMYGDHTIFVKPTDIDIGARYCFFPEESYSELGYKKYSKSLIPKGATCVVTIGSIGQKIILAHKDLFINQAMNAVIPSENYDSLFVFYILKMHLSQLKVLDSGTASGRENVSKSSFSSLRITIPKSKTTQQKIAAILSAYDDLIENNLKRIKLLEEMAQITYEEWFVRMRFPGYESVPTDPTGLPEGWGVKAISTICDVNKTSISTRNAPEKIRYIDISSAETGSYSVPQEMAFSEAPSRARRRVAFGDTIFSLVRPNRRVYSLILEDDPLLVASTGFAVLTPHQHHNFPFIYLTIDQQSFTDAAVAVAGGAAYPAVNQTDFERIKIMIPTAELMKKFSDMFAPNFILKSQLLRENMLLKEARDILLPRLMTGVIDVESYNPADLLKEVA